MYEYTVRVIKKEEEPFEFLGNWSGFIGEVRGPEGHVTTYVDDSMIIIFRGEKILAFPGTTTRRQYFDRLNEYFMPLSRLEKLSQV
jgi:hypothetical protein